MTASNALAALADNTRRAIFERVARQPCSVGEIAATLPVTRPAVSQHLKVLKQAELVTDTAVGTRRIYRIDPSGLGALRQWLDSYLDLTMESFRAFAEAEAARDAETPNDNRADP